MVRELLEQVRAEIGRRKAAGRGYRGTRPSQWCKSPDRDERFNVVIESAISRIDHRPRW